MIRHVVAAAQAASVLDRVIVATDDERIAAAVREFGGEVALTRADHPTGTDRIAEVVADLPDASIVVNIQGDEPELSPEAIDRVAALLDDRPRGPDGDPRHADPRPGRLARPVVRQGGRVEPGRALYFSRASIPMHRDAEPDLLAEPPRRSSIWGSTPTDATSCWVMPSFPPPASKRPRSWNNSASSKPGSRSPRDRGRAERRDRHSRRLLPVRGPLAGSASRLTHRDTRPVAPADRSVWLSGSKLRIAAESARITTIGRHFDSIQRASLWLEGAPHSRSQRSE